MRRKSPTSLFDMAADATGSTSSDILASVHEDALAAARAIEDPRKRAVVLADIARAGEVPAWVPAHLVASEALDAAREIDDPFHCSTTLTHIARM